MKRQPLPPGLEQGAPPLKRWARSCGVAASALLLALSCPSTVSPARADEAATQAPKSQPNILVIMGDDIGWENLGSYHQGLMLDATPNLDKLAKQGLRFTDYYAEACRFPLRFDPGFPWRSDPA
jgi:Sulfatase